MSAGLRGTILVGWPQGDPGQLTKPAKPYPVFSLSFLLIQGVESSPWEVRARWEQRGEGRRGRARPLQQHVFQLGSAQLSWSPFGSIHMKYWDKFRKTDTQDPLIHHLHMSLKNSLCMENFQSLHMYFNTNIHVCILGLVLLNKKQILSPCQVRNFSVWVRCSVWSIQQELVNLLVS